MENWRKSKTVLVTESNAIGSVAVIRSLGRAGYRVIASSSSNGALGFKSRHCSKSYVQPKYTEEKAFFPWLNNLIERENISLIIPSEAFIISVAAHLTDLSNLLPLPNDPNKIKNAMSKFDLFKIIVDNKANISIPPIILIGQNDEPPTAKDINAIGLPVFIKVDAIHSKCSLTSESKVIRCENAKQALESINELRSEYTKILIQGYSFGTGVGAFIATWKGNTLGEFMHKRLHEVPHTGGASSFRESWRNDDILRESRNLMALMKWDGVGMFEYRWNKHNNKFYLMEFNSRFWGSLHLALYAGVDFPKLLADAFFNHPCPPTLSYQDVKCRWTFPREVEYVLSCVKDNNLALHKRIWPVLEFILLSANPSIHSDLLFPGDRMLYLTSIIQTIRKVTHR